MREEDTMQELRGKVAVVTGAAHGIGYGLAERFVAEGMKVMAVDIDTERLAGAVERLAAGGGEVLGRRTDVTKPDDIKAMADEAFERFGNVNVVCNNAGVGAGGKLWEISDNDWNWVIDVNFWGVIHGVRAFLPRMIANGDEGHIVNTASQAGLAAGNIGNSPYAASKAGVVSATESLFKELKMVESKVSASVLCPGYIQTNMAESMRRNRPPEYGEATVRQNTPTGGSQAESGGDWFQPSYVAEEVVKGIREDIFYIMPAQPAFFEWINIRYERMLSGKNPAVPRRTIAAATPPQS
jgi:NAD(P)-dependent dehydrogenase (short-subunit alcohol dehydrogenase family)